MLAVTAVGAATPASAASGSDCGAYPPGQSYGMRISPGYAQVHPGAIVSLAARVYRGGDNCSGRAVGFYRRFAGQIQFHLDYRAVTGSTFPADGLATVRLAAVRDFRFFGNYNSSANTLGARSGGGLVQVR
ncbi:MAG: hypothetical protein NVSMB55_08760 [Mycobacteriales bacterium]